MLKFRYPEIEDKKWIDPIFKNSGYLGADFAFGNLYIWSSIYNSKIAKYNEFLLRIYDNKDIRYAFPVGNGNIKDAINRIILDAREKNIPFEMFGLTKTMVNKLDSEFPGKFNFELQRDMSDYIYSANDLCFLKGKKYHGKRNHISKFKKTYNWQYKDITSDNISRCKEFFEEWFSLNQDKNIGSEKIAVDKAFSSYKELDLIGGYIQVENKIVALTIAEEINKDTVDIHFEKALTEYMGAYTIINQEFAIQNLTKYKYINREEDLGIQGLRKSKMSYHPEILLDRYTACLEKNYEI